MCAVVFASSTAHAQRDLIRTQAGEDIRCRIIDETAVRFVFAYLKDGKPYRSEIFKNFVTDFKFNYYESDLPGADKMPTPLKRELGDTQAERSRTLTEDAGRKQKRTKRAKIEEQVVQNTAPTEKEDKVKVRNAYENEQYRSKDPEEIEPPRLTQKQERKIAEATIAQTKAVSPVVDKAAKTVSKSVNIEPTDLSEATTATEVVIITPEKAEVATVAKKNETLPTAKAVNEANPQKSETVIQKRSAEISAEKMAPVEKTVAEVLDTKVQPDEVVAAEPSTLMRPNKWRVGVKGGIGNRLDNNYVTTNAYDLYLEQLLRGYTFGGDIAYFPRDAVGFGVIYTDFRSGNKGDNLTYLNVITNTELIGNIGNNRSVKFVGPALFLRKKLDFKTYVVLGLSPGYNFYTDKGNYDLEKYTVKGKGFGAAGTLGIDFLLGNEINGRNVILSFEAGYNYGKINKLDYGDERGLVTAVNPIDVSRLDFTVGLRFMRFPRIFRR